MTDDNKDDDQNQKAIKKVVKKSVSDVFGPEEDDDGDRLAPGEQWRGSEAPYGSSSRRPSFLWEKPGYAFQQTNRQKATNLLKAGWGDKPAPQDRRLPGIDKKLNGKGETIGVHFSIERWSRLRERVRNRTLDEMDWERIVLSVDDHVLLEQALDTILRRSLYQIGEPGDSFHKGTLKQVPIWIGDAPPAEPAPPLPASADELDDDTINIRTGDHDDEPGAE